MDRNTDRPQTDLERKILLGLAAEWHAAAEELPDRHRRLIHPPVFALRDMGARLGRWHPERGEIALGRSLAFEHPWDALRDVLLHEMAHQLVSGMPGKDTEAAHGPAFVEACRMLGADPRASGTYPTLRDKIASGCIQENDRLLLRIRKLLALAGSTNRHEAEAAMEKAHDLIRKYNIDLQQMNARRRFVSIFLGKPALRQFREFYHLAKLLQSYYFVQGIWVSAWVVEKEKMGRVLEISGTCANVQTAEYVYHFVCRFIDAEWHRFNRPRRLSRHRKTDFAVGVIEGFAGKLARPPAQLQKPASEALVPMADPQLERYVHRRYPRLRSFRRDAGHQDEAVVEEGMRRGKKLVIARGVENRGSADRPQLPMGQTRSR